MTRDLKSLDDKERIALGDAAYQDEVEALARARNEIRKRPSNLQSFLVTLERTSGIDHKKITLWREIYNNAIADRELAAIVYTGLWSKMGDEIAHHGIYGPIIAKYLERMNRTTDQLLKLAELIATELDNV